MCFIEIRISYELIFNRRQHIDDITLTGDFLVQVMYMYYLLGYKLFGEKEGEIMKKVMKKDTRVSPDHVGKSLIFQAMEEKLLTQVTVVSHAYVFGLLQSVRGSQY